MLYLAADGDDVGNRLEYYMLVNEIQPLNRFSAKFQSAMSWLEEELTTKLGATIILCGGDTLLATLPSNCCSMEALEAIRIDFEKQQTEDTEDAEDTCTLSVGLGKTPREAYLALKLAKASGKNCVQQI